MIRNRKNVIGAIGSIGIAAVFLAVFLPFFAGQVFAEKGASADELFKKGDALLDAGELSEAQKTLREAISVDSGHYNSYVTLGIVYAEKDMLQKALVTFTRAAELKPLEIPPLLNRGEVSVMLDDYDSACKDFLAACRLGQCKRLDVAILKNRCEPNN